MNRILSRKQRALVLGAGGAFGAYEIGVLKTLCRKLKEQDKRNGEENRLLFDIIIGTSIGVIIGTILVSIFLKTRSWEYAIEKLEEFFKDTKKGLASDVSEEDLSKLPCYNRWLDASKNNVKGIASKEAMRRKASSLVGSKNVYYCSKVIGDNIFYDNENNSWQIYNNQPLKDKILEFAEFPIATSLERNEPRLLICAVDALEGQTIVFDSYAKEDGTRKTEFGKYEKETGFEHVITYPGITIEHVMASASVPEYFGYGSVPINQINALSPLSSSSTDNNNKLNNKKDCRLFMDGYLLSSVPFKELLYFYQVYWLSRSSTNTDHPIPNLEAYVISLYPSKSNNNINPDDHDRIICRRNDILFSDRDSHYEQMMFNQKMVLVKGITKLIDLVKKSIDKICYEQVKKEIIEKLEDILEEYTTIKNKNGDPIKYRDLLRPFELKVFRFERKNDKDCISQGVADFSSQSINDLKADGERDAFDCFF